MLTMRYLKIRENACYENEIRASKLARAVLRRSTAATRPYRGGTSGNNRGCHQPSNGQTILGTTQTNCCTI